MISSDADNQTYYDDYNNYKLNDNDEDLTNDTKINSLDSKDKRRHYLIKSKSFSQTGLSQLFLILKLRFNFIYFYFRFSCFKLEQK